MNDAVLAAELTSDPLGLRYFEKSDTEVADALNAPTRPGRRAVPSSLIRRYLFLQDMLLPLESAANAGNAHAAAVTKSVSMFSEFDMADTEIYAKVEAILTALIADGLVTESQRDNLLALADTTISRAAELGLGIVHHLDIARVRRG